MSLIPLFFFNNKLDMYFSFTLDFGILHDLFYNIVALLMYIVMIWFAFSFENHVVLYYTIHACIAQGHTAVIVYSTVEPLC